MTRNHPLRWLATACAVATASTVFAALPAAATTVGSGYNTSNSTGTIGPSGGTGSAVTRAQMIARADDWINNEVPYSQVEGWEDGATGGPYRMDCSGFVSMAWGLSTSLVTWTLPDVSTVTSTDIYGDTNINPGDAVDYAGSPKPESGHVVLFDSWINASDGTFNYDAEHTTGQLTNQSEGSVYASSLEGYPLSYFETLQYDNIATPPPPPTGPVGVAYDNTLLTTGSWTGAKVSDGGGSVSKTALLGLPNGTMDLFTLAYGDVWLNNLNNGTWSGAKIIDGNGSITDMAAAVLTNGVVHLDTLYRGTVYDDVQNANGSWNGANLVDNNGSITDIALGATPGESMHLLTLYRGTVYDDTLASSGSWSGAKLLDNNGGITAIATAVPSGVLHLETLTGGDVWDNTLGSSGWGGAKLADANGSITDIAAAAPGGVLHLETLYRGTVYDDSQTSTGSWSGAKLVDGNGTIFSISATGMGNGTMHLETLVP